MPESSHRPAALLVLEDGWALRGRSYGAQGRTIGEIVFSTGMTGYQETLTDPSYHRQIVVQTAPHIGNTGVNDEDAESDRIWVAGYVVREPARRASSWRSRRELEDDLRDAGIVGLCEVDTRALTRHLREAGAMRGGIFSGDALPAGGTDPGGPSQACIDICLEAVRSEPPMSGRALAAEVTTPSGYVVEPTGPAEGQEPVAVLVAIDLGIKSRTPWQFAERGVRVHVLPQSTTLSEILALRPDGVLFSNGPGDPGTADAEIELLRGVLDAHIPFFGICLGTQVMALAAGGSVKKLPYGHHGGNEPVMNLLTGRVEVTAQNHNYVPDFPSLGPLVPELSGGEARHHDDLRHWSRRRVAPVVANGRYGRIRLTHVNLNDGTPEGMQFLDVPAFSVQYHPEASPGPHDAAYLFRAFARLMEGRDDYLAIDVHEGRRF